jgi:uncharacterized protein YwqG
MMKPLLIPAVHIVHTNASVKSGLGGWPNLPPDFVWPMKDDRPLDFLASIDLSELSATHQFDWLPASGRLVFFYDEEQPWGMYREDIGGWKVVYVEPDSGAVRTDHPDLSEKPKRSVSFKLLNIPPSPLSEMARPFNLTLAEVSIYSKRLDAFFDGQPTHQIGGYPDLMQCDDMRVACEFANRECFDWDKPHTKHPRYEEFAQGAADWRLLLQLDTDDDVDFLWGDSGKIYFWVRKQDARKKDFKNVWLSLQCG